MHLLDICRFWQFRDTRKTAKQIYCLDHLLCVLELTVDACIFGSAIQRLTENGNAIFLNARSARAWHGLIETCHLVLALSTEMLAVSILNYSLSLLCLTLLLSLPFQISFYMFQCVCVRLWFSLVLFLSCIFCFSLYFFFVFWFLVLIIIFYLIFYLLIFSLLSSCFCSVYLFLTSFPVSSLSLSSFYLAFTFFGFVLSLCLFYLLILFGSAMCIFLAFFSSCLLLILLF